MPEAEFADLKDLKEERGKTEGKYDGEKRRDDASSTLT